MKKLASFIISLTLIFLFTGPLYAADGNTTIQSFSKAKKILLRQVYQDHKITFYCGCPFTAKKEILPCDNYIPKKDGKRAHRLEWEHIVPAHAFGQSFPEWRNGHLNLRTGKANPSKAGIVPGRWPRNSDTWSPIYIILSRQLGRSTV